MADEPAPPVAAVDQIIVVVKTPRGYRVIPPSPLVGKGETIGWRNYTGLPIEVLRPTTFPGSIVTGPDGLGNVDVKITGAAVGGTFYPYAVYSAEANDMAVGDSAPGVIIKR